VGLKIIAVGLLAMAGGCAASRQSPCAVGPTPEAVYRPAPAAAANVAAGEVSVGPMNPGLSPPSGAPIIQAQYAAPPGPPQLAAAAPPPEISPVPSPETLPAPSPEILPAPPAIAAGMSLDQAIGATLLADPKIRAGLEAIHQANADLLTSSLPPNPTLQVMGQYLPLRPFTPTMSGGPSELDVQVGYPVDWFLFGKRAAAMGSARLGLRQSEADYADLIRQRVTATATAFYDVLEARSLLELARQDTENLSRLEAATRQAVDAGGRPTVEFNRVRLDLLKSQQDLREAASALAVAKAKLWAQFGRADNDPGFDVAGTLDAPVTAEPLGIEESFAIAQENRPDIQSLRVQVSKAQADVVAEQRKAYPQITPMFGYTRQYETPLGYPDAPSWVASVTTPLPLFDRNQGNREKAQSVAAQDSCNLQAGVVGLRAEVAEAVQNLATAYQTAKSVAQEQVRLAAEVRDSITRAYDAGGRPLVDVLDAQRAFRDTYRLYISSRADYWRALYKYNAAIGKQLAQ
jgi:cobalt-zinc-cadmium efflux system outer membrane protein